MGYAPPVVGEERLQVRVELEPADAALGHEAADLARSGAAAGRVDARERDQHVGVRGGRLRDLLVGDRRPAGRRLVVDPEHDGGHAALAIVGGDVGGRGQALAGPEVAPRRLAQRRRHRVVPARRHLGMRVDVDGADPRDVDHRPGQAIGAWGATGRAAGN
jgi:hypothetical protein